MSENLSNAETTSRNTTVQTGDFFARLQGISLGGALPKTASPSESLQNVCRPTDESSFSRDFLKYRSQIQRELSKEIPGVRSSVSRTFPVSSVSGFSGSATQETAGNVSSNSAFSSAAGNVTPYTQQTTSVSIPLPKADPYTFHRPYSLEPATQNTIPSASAPIPSVSSEEVPSMMRGVSSEEVPSTVAMVSSAVPENNVCETETHPVTAAKKAPTPNAGNPFAKLTVRKDDSTMCASEPSSHATSGWLSSMRCFGILGLIVGLGLTIFSMKASSGGMHEWTALGISLLISGTAMFAFVGMIQAFWPGISSSAQCTLNR